MMHDSVTVKSTWDHAARLLLLGAALGLTFTPGNTSAKDKPTKVAARGESTSKGSVPADHPLAPALRLAADSRRTLEGIEDYSATFIKREKIKNKLVQQEMALKFRTAPLGVYLKWTTPHAGREVIYVEGQNQGKLLVHEDGIRAIAGTLALDPLGDDAMAENRYPISEIGMLRMLDITIQQWQDEVARGETEVQMFPQAKVAGTSCTLIQTTHPVRREHFRFHITRLYIDQNTNLPIRVEQLDWPTKAGAAPEMIEEYTYTGIKTNVGLTNVDFDKKNPAYDF